ncbi:MAG: hypothetical protein AAF515_15310 [Pseudomonadota bacterium]
MKYWPYVLGTVALLALVIWQTRCPCEQLPGGWLLGEVEEAPVEDWSFANDARRCFLQVGRWPHSVTLNCMADGQGRLYVSCSRCAGKYWSGVALDNPAGRLRANGIVYPVTMRRVTDAGELDHAWLTRANKVMPGESPPRPDHWWSFALTSR